MNLKLFNGLVAVVAIALSIAAPSAHATEPNDFAKMFTATVTNGLVNADSTLSDFPLLIRLGSGIDGFDYADFKQNGVDIMVTDSNGTVLPFELENWDTAGESRLWVRVPSVATGTELTVYYGTTETVSPPAGMWSGYAGVWHLNEAGDGVTAIADSTANALDGTSHKSSKARSDGKLGAARGLELDGKNGAMTTVPNDTVLDGLVPTFTVSGWVRPKTLSFNWGYLFARKTSDADPSWGLQFRGGSGNSDSAGIYSNGSADNDSNRAVFSTSGKFTANQWTKYTVVYDNTTIYLYLDGILVGSKAANPGPAVNKSNGFGIGGFPTSANHSSLKADQDEVRLRNGAVSADWVAAEYRQEANLVPLEYGPAVFTDATAPSLSVPVVTRDAGGAFTVTVEVSENVPTYVFCDVDGVTNTMTTADAALPMTYSATLVGLAADATYACLVGAGSSGGTISKRESPTAFYNGDLSVAKISDADENGLVPGIFRISRADMAHELSVTYTVGGTATPSQTYETLSGTATIPAGASYVDIEVIPLLDPDTTVDVTVSVTLDAGLYGIGAQADSAELTIANLVAPAGYNVWIATAPGLASVGSNWSEGHCPNDQENVLFDGRFSTVDCQWDAAASATVASWTQAADYTGTVEFQTTYASGVFPLLSIESDCMVNGGTWTHASNTNVANHAAAQYRLNVSIGGNFTLGAGTRIDVIGRGYNVGRCPADSQVGVHAASARGTYSAVYGNVLAPEDIGSGGESGNKNTSTGGGAVKLAVAGTAVVDGTIAANACSQRLAGANPEKGFGAGGSVFLTASSISGSGKVDVSARPAGVSETAYTSYAGSGGRMALVATSGNVTIPMSNLLADGSWGSCSAGAGTIYLKNATDMNGSLLVGTSISTWSYVVRYVRKGGCTCVKPGETWTFDHVYVRNRGILSVPPNATLSLPGGFESISSLTDSTTPFCGILYLGGTIALPAREEHVLSGPWMFMAAEPFTFQGDLRLTSKASIGSLQLYADSIADYPACIVSVTGDMMVESGASLYAFNRGRRGDEANPAFGYHGGSVANTSNHLSAYDSILSPSLSGTGGRSGDMGNTNPGGGAIVLTVGGTLTLNGNANAGTSAEAGFHVGGAGSISITAGSLVGSGNITANGGSGNGAKSRGAGGGGRVAVRLTNADATFDGFSGSITAWGENGNSGTTGYGSSAGTVYLQDGAKREGAGTVKVANLSNSTAEDAKTGFPSLSSNVAIDDLKNATLDISNNSKVILIADVKMTALEVASGSSIDLNGKTLTMKSAKLGGTKLSIGTYAAGDEAVAGFVTDSGEGGSLVVTGGGFSLFVR